MILAGLFSATIGAIVGYFYSMLDWQLWAAFIIILYMSFCFSQALEEISKV